MPGIRNRTIFTSLLAVLPAIVLACLTFPKQVNAPYWDEYSAPGDLFTRLSQGLPLSFDYLISQHNESRLFFPRLLHLGLAHLGGWDMRHEMLVTFLLACLISFDIYCLSRKTIAGSPSKRLILLFLANLLIFSPMQYENWGWGTIVVMYMSIASLFTALTIAVYSYHQNEKASPKQNRSLQRFTFPQKIAPALQILAYLCLCTFSTFSYANGLLSWLIVFPTAIILSKFSRRSPNHVRWLLGTGLAGFSLNLILYFYNYQTPPKRPSFWLLFIRPGDAFQFYTAFLGSSLGAGSMLASQMIGIVFLVLFVGICIYLYRNRHSDSLLSASTVWVAIAGYILLTTLLTTGGRMGFGLEQALAVRYITFSLCFPVALIYLLTIVFHHVRHNSTPTQQQTWLNRGLSLGVIALLLMYGVSYTHGVRNVDRFYRGRLQAETCLRFIYTIRDEKCVGLRLFPSSSYVIDVMNAVKTLGLNTIDFLETSHLSKFAVDKNPKPEYGALETFSEFGTQFFRATGWAIFPDRKTVADVVLLAYEKADGEPIAFRITDVYRDRPDVVKTLNQRSYRNSGWAVNFDKSILPADVVKVSAWAFDTKTNKAYRLANTQSINEQP